MAQTRKSRLIWFVLLTGLAGAIPQLAQTPEDKLVEVEKINVQETRLPSDSLIRLSGIKLHDKVNNLIVNAACQKIAATGLVKSVSYAYDAYPDRPGVDLVLIVTDEGPLLPATIKPAADESWLWPALQARDPIFTRELPPTEKALDLYSKNLEKCLQAKGRNNEYANADVMADPSGKLIGVVFEIRQYKALSRPK